jgi:hypothetical protein
MSLDVNIPDQETPSKDGFPVAPRKVKKWLAQLSRSNIRETTRAFYNGLHDSNHLKINAKDRIESMELMRPVARSILDNLEKRFLALGLPLPEKTRRIFDLNLALLQQLAMGYKAALVDAANGQRLPDKLLALASERALVYLTEIMVRSAQVYSPIPKGLWQDMHRLYGHAEQEGVIELTVKDSEVRLQNKFTISQAYRRALLFSLARPESLRRGDAERVFAVLEKWCTMAKLDRQNLDVGVNGVFAVNLNGHTPPSYPDFIRSGDGVDLRYIDVREVLDVVRDVKNSADEVESPLAQPDTISPSALRRLEINWGMSTERSSRRAKKARRAAVEVGIKDIHTRIMSELEPLGADEPEEDSLELTLQAIPQSERREVDRSGFVTHPSHKEQSDGPDVWDVVGSGNVLTAAYREELVRKRRESERLIDVQTNQDWRLIDISAGGYGLRWEGDTPSKAHVGEVVGLRELQRGTYAQWRIGVIRWMQFIDENCFEAGIQALSPHGMAVLVDKVSASKSARGTECLVLPEIKPIGQSTSLLAPAHMYKTGDTVRVRIFEKDLRVTLTGVVEHTGSFTQFTMESANIGKSKPSEEKESLQDDGRFDSGVWRSI